MMFFGFAFGFPVDPAKSVDCSVLMVVLGLEVALQSARTLSLLVSPRIRLSSGHRLWKIGDTAICSPELGARMAGSLSLEVPVTCDRVGCAVVEPF